MRQLTFISPGRLEWQDVPAPVVQRADDVIVEPLAVARCDLDVYIAYGLFPVEGSFAFGHEVVARVVDAGEAVENVQPGDMVTFPFQISCGECDQCRRGHTNACLEVVFRSSFGLAGIHGQEWGGGFSDLMRVPFGNHMVFKLPAGANHAAIAGAADNVADGYRAVAAPLQHHPGADVLIVGGLAQSVGMYAALAARALTNGRVVYVDTDPGRLASIAAAGIETWNQQLDAESVPGVEFPVTVEASASQDGLTFAIRATAPAGICTCVAGGVQPLVTIPRMDMYGRGITLDISRAEVHRDFEEVIDHIHAGRIDPLQIAAPLLTFDDAPEAMTDPAPKLVFVR